MILVRVFAVLMLLAVLLITIQFAPVSMVTLAIPTNVVIPCQLLLSRLHHLPFHTQMLILKRRNVPPAAQNASLTQIVFLLWLVLIRNVETLVQEFAGEMQYVKFSAIIRFAHVSRATLENQHEDVFLLLLHLLVSEIIFILDFKKYFVKT